MEDEKNEKKEMTRHQRVGTLLVVAVLALLLLVW